MVQEKWKPFKDLDGHQFINLTTFCRNGDPVSTPLWFAHDGDRLYAVAPSNAALVHHIRRNAQVEVAAQSDGSRSDENIEAMALVLPEEQTYEAKQALMAKYGLHKRLFDLRCALLGRRPVYLEITPM